MARPSAFIELLMRRLLTGCFVTLLLLLNTLILIGPLLVFALLKLVAPGRWRDYASWAVMWIAETWAEIDKLIFALCIPTQWDIRGGEGLQVGARAEGDGRRHGVGRAEFEALAPLSWPVNGDWPKGRARLFEDGRFATPDGRARLLPLAQHFPPQPEAASRGEDLSLLLNSGRLRDQWHTMTRTGHVPRLQEAEPWPKLRVGAASLLALGLAEGDLVRLSNGLGEARLLIGVDEGLREGRPSCPCTGPTASAARGRSTASSPPWWIPSRASPCSSRGGCGPAALPPAKPPARPGPMMMRPASRR